MDAERKARQGRLLANPSLRVEWMSLIRPSGHFSRNRQRDNQ